MKQTPTLETERLLLRKLKMSDASTIYRYFSNREMTKYYGMEPFITIIEAEKFIKDFLDDYTMLLRWGIVEKSTNKLIGTCGYHAISEKHKRAEIGYEIDLDSWGKGYATEAVTQLVEYGLTELKLHRIGANVFPENKSSRKVLEKIGFKHEGLLRNYLYQGGKSHDANVFSIINDNTR